MTIHMLIRGGLGNQMFQAAMALLLEERFRQPVDMIDLTTRARVEREWQLGVFGIPMPSSGPTVRRALLAEFKVRHSLERLGGRHKLRLYRDDAYYNQAVSPRFAFGYFQGMRHMYPIIEQARKRFVFPNLPPHRVLPSTDRVRVGLHVRRGDYLTDQVAHKYHHVCSPNWYQHAIEEARRKIGAIELVLVSDDVPGAVKDLKLESGDYITLPTKSGDADWMDLAQMSELPHMILSNSSFSWWAAQLIVAPDKVVIAPKRWYPQLGTEALGVNDGYWTLL